VAWGWGLSILDAGMLVAGYLIAIAGVTVGFHRHLTHGSFKARRPLRIALAVAGSFAIEGAPTKWVADHRRHHAFADRDGDPHSPWRYGNGVLALTKGMLYAHCGWLLNQEITNKARFAPDLVADRDIRVVDRLFVPLLILSLAAPAAIGGLVTGSWTGALTGFFWGGLVRMALLHHVTWSVNSICHVVGERPFASKDKATNFWPLALLSFGESWHNSHHADPTGARHGVLPGQLDPGAPPHLAVREGELGPRCALARPGPPHRQTRYLMATSVRPRRTELSARPDARRLAGWITRQKGRGAPVRRHRRLPRSECCCELDSASPSTGADPSGHRTARRHPAAVHRWRHHGPGRTGDGRRLSADR
jgi:stearoyl-CoA desaturase (delta-9 desaturase)